MPQTGDIDAACRSAETVSRAASCRPRCTARRRPPLFLHATRVPQTLLSVGLRGLSVFPDIIHHRAVELTEDAELFLVGPGALRSVAE